MFTNMNMTIVAEGVETTNHQTLMTNVGVDYIQGYFYAKPAAKEDTINLIRETLAKAK